MCGAGGTNGKKCRIFAKIEMDLQQQQQQHLYQQQLHQYRELVEKQFCLFIHDLSAIVVVARRCLLLKADRVIEILDTKMYITSHLFDRCFVTSNSIPPVASCQQCHPYIFDVVLCFTSRCTVVAIDRNEPDKKIDNTQQNLQKIVNMFIQPGSFYSS